MTSVPYGTRLARHAAAGLSQVRSPSGRDASRTSALVNPAVDQRERGTALVGGALAGPMVAEIVEVDAEHDGAPRGAAIGPTTSISSALQW